MNLVIQKYKLKKFLDGSYPCPPQFTNPRNQANGIENSLYTDWMDEDASIIMWIHSTISDSVIPYFSRAITSYELWKNIEERFSRASSTHSIQLRTKILSITQGTKSITTLINEIKSLSDQLAAVGEVISDKELVVITLKALNSDYIPFATSMRHRNPPISCIKLHNNLLSEEAVVSERAVILKSENDAKDFMAHSGRGSYNYGRGSYTYSRGSYRGGGYGCGSRFPNPVIFHIPNYARGYPSSDKQPCQICLDDGHTAPNCTQILNFSYKDRAPPANISAMLAAADIFDDEEWVADSGANNHIKTNTTTLHEVSPYDGSEVIQTANGVGMSITHKGHSSRFINDHSFHLNDILVVPAASHNLLSIHRFTSDNNWSLTLDSHGFS